MKKSDFVFIFSSFLIWRIALFIFLFLAIKYVPLQKNFLGGGMENYLKTPWLWAWANFDGEHYLSIAQFGYKPLTYFFFPLFPILTRFFTSSFANDLTIKVVGGLLLTNISFLVALIGLWRLINLDFNRNIAKLSILLLLVFPTSFYFGSFYTESLFLALTIWSFFFARKGKWILSGVLGGLATATRFIGIALFVALLAEFWIQKKDLKNKTLTITGLLFVPLGLFIYLNYLKVSTGDPLNFLNTVSIFGEQRSSELILLPQVFFRYFFKILPNVNVLDLHLVLVLFLELGSAVLFLFISLLSFLKLRLSYTIYTILGFVIPTLSGSFSSLPRYVLVIFPSFILLSYYMVKLSPVVRYTTLGLLFFMLFITTALFARGFWIA